MKIVIAGGRDFTNKKIAYEVLDTLDITSEDIILSGHASGADMIGEQYAKEHGIKCKLYPAEWKKYGKIAGPIRNEQMAKNADKVIAFWDGKSRGTKSMINLAKQYKCQLSVFNYNGQEEL